MQILADKINYAAQAVAVHHLEAILIQINNK
jgi:hypothetical protein